MASPEKSGSKRENLFVVEIMNGPEDGRTIECSQFPITIGRASDNTAHLPYDHLISRYHAQIKKNGNLLTLCDLESTNGTFYREKRVKEDVSIDLNKPFRTGATLLTIRLQFTKG